MRLALLSASQAHASAIPESTGGQTNFGKMLFKFDSVYNAQRQIAEHREPVKYQMSLPQSVHGGKVDRGTLYIHPQELVKLPAQT